MMKTNRRQHQGKRPDENHRPGEAGRAAAFAIFFICAFVAVWYLVIVNALEYLGASGVTIDWVVAIIALALGGGLIYLVFRANSVPSPQRRNWPWD
jgi:hypothetical protein